MLEHKFTSVAYLFHGMWDFPRPGIEPTSLALAGGFFTTEPPGKPVVKCFNEDFVLLIFFFLLYSWLKIVRLVLLPCYCFGMHACMHAKSLQSCPTLCDAMDSSPPGCPWDSLGKNTGVGCHFLLPCLVIVKSWKDRPVTHQTGRIYWACCKQYNLQA